MEIGTAIAILLNGVVSIYAVAVTMLHGMITAETEKAIQITTTTGKSVWLPRKALIKAGDYYKLAPWFKPDRYQAAIFNTCEANIIAA